MGLAELENRNSTIGFNGSTTRTPVSTSIPQSVYNQTSSFTKTASTTRVAGNRSSLHKGKIKSNDYENRMNIFAETNFVIRKFFDEALASTKVLYCCGDVTFFKFNQKSP